MIRPSKLWWLARTMAAALLVQSLAGPALVTARSREVAGGEMRGAWSSRGEKPPSSEERKWTAHASYVFGYKRLEQKWAPAQNQVDFGLLDFDIRRARWPVSFATELSLTYTPNKPRLPGFKGNFAGTYELNIGARKVWERWLRTQPFLGAGFSIVGGSTTTHISGPIYIQEDNNARPGAWGEAGLYWPIGKRWHTGLRTEFSEGRITLFGQRLNAGGAHLMILFGRRW